MESTQTISGQEQERSSTAMSDPKNMPDLPAAQPENFTGESHPKERRKASIAIIMLALAIAVFLAALDTTIITTALETIAEDLHSSAGFTWIGSAYLLAAAASTPLWGKISDIFGRKPILLLANFIFFIGSLVAGLSINIGMLISARVIQGIGSGGLLNLPNIIIGDLFSPRSRGAYYGVIGSTWALAASLGPIVGGVFTTKVTWRWCFYINLPLDGLSFFILLFFLDITTPKTPLMKGLAAIDWLGAFFTVAGTLLFLFGLELGGTSFPWNSATVICLLVFGAVAAVLSILVEAKVAKYPIIPGRIFKHASNLASLGVCFLHALTYIAGSFYLPLYFQAVLGNTPLLSGVHTLATSLSTGLSSISTGFYIRKTGMYLPPIYFGLTLMTLGYGLFIDLSRTSSWAKIIIYQIVAGLGVGPNFQGPLIALQSRLQPRDIGTATSTFGFIRMLGSSISIVIGSVLFQNQLAKHGIKSVGSGGVLAGVGAISQEPKEKGDELREQYSDALQKMWILYVGTSSVGLLLSLLIRKKELSKVHQDTRIGLAAQEADRMNSRKIGTETV
ncbi:putative dothistromin transporter [Xylogone sp. PMI_703]|nr:putative dothistromin transporter [Xylogone sp. PMI_703]